MGNWTTNEILEKEEVLYTYEMSELDATEIALDILGEVPPSTGLHGSLRDKVYGELSYKSLIYIVANCEKATSETRLCAMSIILYKTIDGSERDKKLFTGATKRLPFSKLRDIAYRGLESRFDYLSNAERGCIEIIQEIKLDEVKTSPFNKRK